MLNSVSKLFQIRAFSAVLFILAFAPLMSALVSQYFFGLKPCELCVYQRIPYIIMLIFASLAFVLNSRKIFLISLVIIFHMFIINIGLSFYHVGVENFWWSFGDCSSDLDMNSIEALRQSLSNAATVRCDEVQFEFLSISMAGWNLIYSFFISILLVKYFFQYINKTKKSLEEGFKK